MRIIGGQFKGKQLRPGKKFTARPTTDFARESLFNILRNRIDFEEVSFLDLFGGTGAISYEMASHGCRDITIVEKDSRHFTFIRECLDQLNISRIVSPIRGDVFRFVSSSRRKFDVVFADPPYELGKIEEIPEKIFGANLLNEDGLLIVEHGKKTDYSTHPNFRELRRYGSVHFSFFWKIEEAE
ncbi:RsmD family RNA methyltransferase [Halosquirtibacter xylanolyticus]|uniref:RsmD family RNA methyltransferase n=1 Tax=Halosquirtibacter xylanolyticus TaxID=3374599 RepID=UPI0037497043|nr:RsmD family RNA methyltransferase [Prolixibacteraceae bacterium]